MGDTIYPVDNRTRIRARDMIQRCRNTTDLASLVGQTEGAWAHVRGLGMYRAALGDPGDLPADAPPSVVRSTATDCAWQRDIESTTNASVATLLDYLAW